ncbi:PP2C family protein-serine/threonine phosphatase [Streptomyces sp. NPDC051644]|uniref:PP2C family protein-serine/threonine phosphatase n=1 Tax=Streptomyces sp. NPDC051644 TaxID=3365666 RepID=UPI0037954015
MPFHSRAQHRDHVAAQSSARMLPEVSAISSGCFYLPGKSDASWFDVIPLSSARVGLVIGQVPDHGLQASVTMGRFRTAVSTLADLDLPPDELLVHLDDVATRIASDHISGSDVLNPGPSCMYAVYEPATCELTLASAGWPEPLLSLPNGSVTSVDMPIGPSLGHGASYESSHCAVPPGSLLAFYSGSLLGRSTVAPDRMKSLRAAVAQSGRGPARP